MSLGGWNIDVNTHGMPQVVASAMANLEILGATYESIAYLGSQVVNGVKHAVLATQTLATLGATKNVVLIEFLEQNGVATLSSISPVLTSGGEYGGVNVDPNTDLSKEVLALFNLATAGFVGSKIEPFALLGTQVTKGVNYIFAATLQSVTPAAEKSVSMVTINSMSRKLEFEDILG